jgi:MFS transporter, SP family, general alpha glucoside:H+ symporter
MGRSFAELDVLFEKEVSARKFATTQVDVFGDGGRDGSPDGEGVNAASRR